PTDGSAQAGERHPCAPGTAEEGPQVRLGTHRGDPQQSARVRLYREGVRHAHGRAEVRPGQGRPVPEPVPDQPVEDRRWPLRPAARGADWPLQPLRRRSRRRLQDERALLVRPSEMTGQNQAEGATATRPVFVITGTSGEGKSTLAKLLAERIPELELAISATTRPRRPGEEDGRDYWFISDE